MKRFFKALLTLLILAGLAYGGYWLYQRQQTEEVSETQVQYTPVAVSMGSLSREVISTGSLTIAETAAVTAPAAVTIDQVKVRAGQQVAPGDVLATVDPSTLDTALYTLETELETVDSTLVSLANDYENQQTLYTPIGGRVKLVYAQKGDRVQDVVAAHGCLYVLSLDGKMCVEIPVSEETTLGSRLGVTSPAGYNYSGAVVAVGDTTATVTFSDLAALPGETVTVQLSEERSITAECAIHMPLEVSSTAKGVITSVLVSPDEYCNKRSSSFVVSYLEPTQEYADALTRRQELVEEMTILHGLKADPTLKAEEAGIVSAVSAADGQALLKGDAVMTLYVGQPDQMTISVDELDIIHVKEGQTATVAMDAITDKTYNATVTYLSTLGTASGGITGYDVTVQLEADEQLKLGMNGTVTIAVGQQENVLLVPLTALQTDAQGSYVWLYSAEHTPTEEAPGVKTYVNTGLSNEDYAAVTGGLRPGDQVLVVRSTASGTSAEDQAQMPGGMMQMSEGMQMPEGIQMPGERPEGGFGGGRTGQDGSTGGRSGSGGSSGGGRPGQGSGSGSGGN